MFLSWRRHTGVKNLYFRIINMFGKPVGGDKKAVVMGISIVTWLWSNCRTFPEKGQVEEAVLAGETTFLCKIFASSQ
ncbi:hypothetical protein HFT18_06245 [Salmonella enterica subsp. enterica serovar Kentucky]|nr:hypothetical protein [Salmonella enterica]QQH90665.1 hypothetical protein HFT18_06245 [Salmonella enterica subsp. enterica serovar Kentucky]